MNKDQDTPGTHGERISEDTSRPSSEPADSETMTNRDSSTDHTGDILRKERITRRIAIETIARDLKLNATYIKNLEANRFEALPSDPYIRVYLRSIAKYLLLDPDKILEQFFRERGLVRKTHLREAETKIDISVIKDDRPAVPWLIVIILIVVLAAAGYIANHMGLLSDLSGSREPATPAANIAEDIDTVDMVPGIVPDSLIDTLEKEPAEAETGTAEKSRTQIKPDEPMRLVLQCIMDSVWVHVISDGTSWKNFIYTGRARAFTAVDSFNLHVGQNINIRYTLNNKPLRGIPGDGVVTFRLDRNGVEMWPLSKWMKTFNVRQ